MCRDPGELTLARPASRPLHVGLKPGSVGVVSPSLGFSIKWQYIYLTHPQTMPRIPPHGRPDSASSTPRAGKLFLHETIAVILLARDRRIASIDAIAAEIIARELYHRKDGQPLPPYQVMQKAKLAKGQYRHLFKWLESNFVWLKNLPTL
jgi:hypothetical protein